MDAVTLRLMQQEDLPAADALRELIGWNQTLHDWRRMLDLEPAGCFVATREGAMIGTVTTITYGFALGWIGMMLVHPDYRRQGVATRLMVRAIDYLKTKGIACVKLDATPAGKSLYGRLGFLSERGLTRWQLAQKRGRSPTGNVELARPLQPQDWPAVDDLERAAFGLSRPQLLRNLAEASTGPLVWPREWPIAGWGMLRPGANADYLGPAVCLRAEGAGELVSGLLSDVGQRPVYWDIPDQNDSAMQIAQKLGFTPVRPLTRMFLGSNTVISDPRRLFGIADPALG